MKRQLTPFEMASRNKEVTYHKRSNPDHGQLGDTHIEKDWLPVAIVLFTAFCIVLIIADGLGLVDKFINLF